ncbi:MAG: TCR/Tet family MFS transporter [Phycisphaeraceae bacterium]|nr:TCR/Tet family MFS transporter [Phycisphaeraceae bacterium]
MPARARATDASLRWRAVRPKPSPAIGFIFLTLLLDVLGFGVIIPVAPRLVQSLLNGGAGGSDSQAAYVVGWLAATYAIMQFLFSPLLGALSDRVGRRPVLLVAIFGSGIDYFAMAFAPTLMFFFITRAINGLSGASMTVCNAYIADITAPEKRAAAFGMIGAAFGLGFILGPLAGGFLGEINIHLPFYVAGGLSLANWLYGLLVLPESLPRERRSHLNLARANPVAAFYGLGRYPLVAGLAAAMFLLNLAMFGLHMTWVLYTKHRYDWSPLYVGLSLFCVGLGAVIVQAGLVRKIVPWLGERRSLLIGLCIGVVAYIGYGAATQGWMIYVIIAFASLGGIAQPAAQAIITKTVRPYEQGEVQGALTSLQCVAQIAGPLMATWTFGYFISDQAPIKLPGASFFLGAIFSALGTGVAAWATMGYSARDPHPAATGTLDVDPATATAE